MFSLLFGGLMRLAPEVFKFLNKKEDYKHELRMLEFQSQLETTRAQNRMAEIELQGRVDLDEALVKAQETALKSQMQKTGFAWVDAMNFLVRPVTTYYFLLMYGVVKTAMIYTAIGEAGTWTAIVDCWSPADHETLAGILGFWFVGRVFDKAR